MRSYYILTAWTFLAGAGIPFVGVLNNGMARHVGNPFAPTMMMFVVGLLVTAGIVLPIYGAPNLAQLRSTPVTSYGAGLIIGFYALSATVIIPRLGAATFVAFILIAQLVTSAVIDQFGLLGMAKRPIDLLRLTGLAVIATGIAIIQIANQRSAAS